MHEGHDPKDQSVALVGAGGAGSAIAVALLQAGVSDLHVTDRDECRLARLRTHLASDRASFEPAPNLRDVDLVINATPLGMAAGDDLPFAVDELPPHAVVADIVMKPHETRLLVHAAARGHAVHHGIHMLTHQLAGYLRFFGIGDQAQAHRQSAHG